MKSLQQFPQNHLFDGESDERGRGCVGGREILKGCENVGFNKNFSTFQDKDEEKGGEGCLSTERERARDAENKCSKMKKPFGEGKKRSNWLKDGVGI